VSVIGVGVDLVHVPSFASQLSLPGSRFDRVFTASERAYAMSRSDDPRHLAARWAAKEAVVKAWSASLYGTPPPHGDEVLAQIETVNDVYGRPRILLHGAPAAALSECSLEVSLSHDGDYAIAFVVLTR
jgi:holo-[acyl-carrier protein] synthase